tara:strand:+ start:468 stop:743 length:276 start_codon:yes stop_codon:yes gene_type:complete
MVPLHDSHAVLKKASVLTPPPRDDHEERAPRRRLSDDAYADASAPAGAAAATSSGCLPLTSTLSEVLVMGGAGTLQMPNAQRMRKADAIYI